MDEAFLPFSAVLESMLAYRDGIIDEERGVRSVITAYEIDTPTELDVSRNSEGSVQVGTVPPLYTVETSIRPSLHRLRFRAELTDGTDA